ncbi:MAG: hypothetical protein ABJE66_26920 [Deltaproteobacteria bacterium]
MSVPRALLLVLALLQATGIAEALRREACETECRDDGCDNDCTTGNGSPSCPCHCPSAVGIAPPAIAVMTLATPSDAKPIVFAGNDRAQSSPDPREILHVPRRAV